MNSRIHVNFDKREPGGAQCSHDEQNHQIEVSRNAPRPAAVDATDLPITATRAPLHDRLLPLHSVMEFAGLGKTMIYRMMRAGNFPAAYKPGGHASRWSERELIEWQAAVAAKRYQPPSPLRP